MHPAVAAGVVILGGAALIYGIYSLFTDKESCHKHEQSSKPDDPPPNVSGKIFRCRKCKGIVSEYEVVWTKATGYNCEACFKELRRLNKRSNGRTCLSCGETPTVLYKNCFKDHRQLCEGCLHNHYHNASCPEEECRELKKRL